MTWHSFFNLSTMGHRHILAVYTGVWTVQAIYLARIAWNWHHTKAPRN
jgi:hypothetical protein